MKFVWRDEKITLAASGMHWNFQFHISKERIFDVIRKDILKFFFFLYRTNNQANYEMKMQNRFSIEVLISYVIVSFPGMISLNGFSR